MLTTLTINGTGYPSTGWGDINLYGLRLEGNDEGYPSLSWMQVGCGPAAPFPAGSTVQLFVDYGGGSILEFTGDIRMPEQKQGTLGPMWSYSCTDLKRRADNIALLAPNGLATASYNLSPKDPLSLFSLSGKTVGQIITDILQGNAVASALDGVGVGNYTVVGPVYTLPSATSTDLGALTVVPTSTQLQGESVLNTIEGFLQRWHSQYTLFVAPDGTIRVISIFGRTAHTFTLPSAGGAGDPVDGFEYKIDLLNCYGAVQITGQDIGGTVLSYADGTLTHVPLPGGSPAWTSLQFNNATNSNDDGTLSSVTANTCVVHSNHPTVFWGTNYWNNNGGVIVFYDLAATGITITDVKQITACTAMAPGGTATITWDASLPLGTFGYTAYRMYSTATPENQWDRAFYVTEPATGATGLSTYVGSHMYPIFPYGFPWGNLGKGANLVQTITQPAAKVLWSINGQWPYFEESIGVKLDPQHGTIVLDQPAVFLSAAMAGQMSGLTRGYPTTFFDGLWVDVQVAIPFNRGDLNTRFPASGFQGTAYTKYNQSTLKTIPLASFVWAGNAASLNMFAQQYLLTVQDAVINGSLRVHFDSYSFGFDPLQIGYAISINTPGGASDIDGLNLPVRSYVMEWPNDGPDIHLLTFTFSNKHRPFEGEDLYLPHGFSAEGWGNGDEIFSPGAPAAFGSNLFAASSGEAIGFSGSAESMLAKSGMEGRPERQAALRKKHADEAAQHASKPIVVDNDAAGASSAPKPGSLASRRGDDLYGPDATPTPPATPVAPAPPPKPPEPPRRTRLADLRGDDSPGSIGGGSP